MSYDSVRGAREQITKVREKLHYVRSNPVKAKLVQRPRDWPWSSWCYYYRKEGLLKMDTGGEVRSRAMAE